jgi:OOP family OmpA-OmpF porin
MKYLFLFLWSFGVYAQVTQNPSIERKSATNVFINKVEITGEHTVFHMQFYEKSVEQDFDQYMDENPGLAQRLKSMGMDREDAIAYYRKRIRGEQTISIQPGSKVVLPDGKKFKFIKAQNIPVSPERKVVEDGKKYFFKVYFERIPEGFQKIDLIEYDSDREGTFQYWNFYGIKINNPKNRQPAKDSPVEAPKPTDFRIYGKVLNAETGKTIHAKVRVLSDSSADSLQTSRTGKYEFLVNEEDLQFTLEAPGFQTLQEKLNIKLFLKSDGFEKDFYLEPLLEEPIEVSEETVGLAVDSSTFKLDKVYFELGQSRVLETSYKQLNELAALLHARPELKIQVEGHTDNQGDPGQNQKLSMERAFNVRKYLIERGIDGNRIKFKGYGSTKPVSPNDTEENRSKNRRVEYQLLGD